MMGSVCFHDVYYVYMLWLAFVLLLDTMIDRWAFARALRLAGTGRQGDMGGW